MSALLILLLCSSAVTAIVPFTGDLPPDLEHRYAQLNRVYRTNDREANRLAFALFDATAAQPEAVRVWALLNYCHLLLENDSIAKAQRLLMDPGVDWATADAWLRAYHRLNLGLLSSYRARYTDADLHFRTALSLHSKGISDQLKVKLLAAYAENLRFQGKLDISLNRWYEALELSERMRDSSAMVQCYAGRGVVRFLKREFAQSEEDIAIMFDYYGRIGNRKKLAYAYSLMSLLKYQADEHEAALEHSLRSYEIRKEVGDVKGQGESLNNLALSYMGLENWNQALTYLEEAMQLKTQANDLTQMTVLLNNTGHCHQRLGDAGRALKYFNLSLDKATENGQMGDVVIAMRNIMRLYASEKRFEDAYGLQVRLTHIKDSLARTDKVETINDLEVRYETEKKEHEILLLQQRQTITTNRWLTLALGLFLIIVISLLYNDNQKRKHLQEKKLLLAEDELRKAELKTMTDQLEHNRNRLSIYTENLLRKNELVSQLEARLNELADGAQGDPEKSRRLMNDFSTIRILTDEDWDEFKALFEDAHSGLLRKLLDRHNNLTPGEQRLFLLMKLSLSTKEIANILGVSPDSVKKGRYRLKRKIGLPDAAPLQDFINSFG